MLVLVCGSRTFGDAAHIREILAALPRGTKVIHGDARGADKVAATVATSLGFEVAAFPASWRTNGKYNPGAGKERNLLMLDQNPDKVIAFWDGVSTGTKHTITQAQKRNIPTHIVFPKRESHGRDKG
jgi:hypothetical protein